MWNSEKKVHRGFKIPKKRDEYEKATSKCRLTDATNQISKRYDSKRNCKFLE